MRIESLIVRYGSQQKAADEVGIDKSTFSAWKRKGGIPFGSQCDIEELTEGALIANREHDPKNVFYKPEEQSTAA
jgi:hypothetical protein